jgi:ABC-type transport system involved in cytochrome c biogenesis permease subunit
LGINPTARAEAPAAAPALDVDVTTAREIPVYHYGRVMPLDSLAKVSLETICGSSSVKLGLEGYYTPEQLASDASLKPALEMFPDGKLRRMNSVEVLLSWLVESEKWEDVPFILCQHADLHKALGVESTTETGLHRKFVSPRMISQSPELLDTFFDYDDRRKADLTAGRKFKATPEDERVFELVNRYRIYRKLTFDPRLPLGISEVMQPGSRDDFLAQFRTIIEVMKEENHDGKTFESLLIGFMEFVHGGGIEARRSPLAALADAAHAERLALVEVQDLAGRMFPPNDREVKDEADEPKSDEQKSGELKSDEPKSEESKSDEPKSDEPKKSDEPPPPPTLAEAEAAIINLRKASKHMAELFADEKNKVFDKERFTDTQAKEIGVLFRELASKAKRVHQLTRQLHLALYDNGGLSGDGGEFSHGATVYVVPALNSAALIKDRDDKSQAEPWLNLQAVLYGSDALLYGKDWPNENYAQGDINAVRAAWKELAKTYTQRQSPRRAEDFAAAQVQLAAALRTLGEGVEQRRVKLVEAELTAAERDEKMIAYTKYPAPGALAPELTYNRIKPFQWSWVICFVSVLAFGLSFGRMRHYAFWAGMGLLLLTLIWTAYGFYLRILVTGWAPVTNMYETIVFVPWVIAALAMWFVLLPLTWTGISDAWRLSAVPGTWEAGPLDKRRLLMMSRNSWTLPGFVLAPVRVALMGVVFYNLAIALYSDGNRPVFDVLRLPEGGVTDSVGWLIAWGTLLALVWFGPRVILTAICSLVFIPWSWRKDRGWQFMLPNVYPRWAFGACGAAVATFLLLIAAYTPLNLPKAIDDDFKPLQPVLRSNFWLTIHVLTIVASYGAGLLAWGIGLLGLTHYLFGKYRDPVIATNVPKGMQPAGPDRSPRKMGRLPPEECATLANYSYRAVQVAVLLLAAGTILGGLWADVSWGRFWGWDPKEVWALISLLVYLAILHGRYAGWFNNFGMIAGTIVGAVMIAGSWYGVNFLLPLIAPDNTAGKHSYGTGAGGEVYVLSFLGLNIVYLILAGLRYRVQTGSSVVPIEHTPEIVAPEIIRGEPRPQGM